MTDKLFYKVPFGPIGKLADLLFVHRKVEGIFRYRKSVLESKAVGL